MILRKKIVNKVKPKMLNGKTLSGEMLSELLVSYVAAINEGAEPSIENSGTIFARMSALRHLKTLWTYTAKQCRPPAPSGKGRTYSTKKQQSRP